MKKCCYIPANLQSYGAAKKVVEIRKGILVIRYMTYLRCRECGSQLKGDTVKTIHDRKAAKV